jgi:hypothetical protein
MRACGYSYRGKGDVRADRAWRSEEKKEILLQRGYAISARTLYINSEAGHTPKGEVEKNYWVCYQAFWKKETSCKEIRVSSTKLKL